jgi:predicted DNA-binding transcriptional regulator YafY
MAGNGGRRDKMRDECISIHEILLKRREVSLADLADEAGVSIHTARRWVNSFMGRRDMAVEIQRGRVTAEPLTG